MLESQEESLYSYNSIVKESENLGIHIAHSWPCDGYVSIGDCEITDNASYGIYCSHQASPIIANSTVSSDSMYAIYCSNANSSNPTITGCTFIGNAPFAIRMGYDSNVYDNTFSGYESPIEIPGGEMNCDGTWRYPGEGVWYCVSGDLTVCRQPNANVLTINPGVVIKFASDAGLQIGYPGYGTGRIKAVGTADSMITFTSLSDTSNGWDGIYFDQYWQGSVLSHCVIENAGQTGWSYHGANLYFLGGSSGHSISLDNCVIRNSALKGVSISSVSGSSDLTQCAISGNGTYGLYCYTSPCSISNSNIVGNSEYGVYNASTSLTVDARSNWWGDSTGPYDPSPGPPGYNPNGLGDAVTDYVDYGDWLDQPVNFSPLQFSLLFPEDNDTLNLPVRLDWEDAEDPNPEDQIFYSLFLSPDPSFIDPVILDSLTESEYTFGEIPFREPLLSPTTGNADAILDNLNMRDTAPTDTAYYWKVKAYDQWGAYKWSNQVWSFYFKAESTFIPYEEASARPKAFFLSQNYPNPFNPITEIKYALPRDCWVRLEVYNILGQRVATLVDGEQRAGYKVARWNARSSSSGIYFCRLKAGDFVQTRKMVLTR